MLRENGILAAVLPSAASTIPSPATLWAVLKPVILCLFRFALPPEMMLNE